jgi:hypothetical protein
MAFLVVSEAARVVGRGELAVADEHHVVEREQQQLVRRAGDYATKSYKNWFTNICNIQNFNP